MSHVVLSDLALCDEDDVGRLVPGYTREVDTDDVVVELINSESQTAFRFAGREFVVFPASGTRLFDIDDRHVRTRVVAIGDASTITTVVVKDINGATLETVASADRVSLPRTRAAWEPITELWFPPTTSPATLSDGNVLHVTANWGFPAVPDDVRLAVAKLVLVRYLADVASAGTALAAAANQQGFDAGIAFVSARDVLRSYRPAAFA